MIKYEDISVVVQGAIDPILTKLNLLNIRKFLPRSKIILSTWDGSNLDGLDFDELVLSKDPGGLLHNYCDGVKVNNVNRLIVSSLNGIKVAKSLYVFKIRSDFLLQGNSFLKFFNLFEFVETDFALFEHKILACSYFTRDPNTSNLAYHPSDIAFFGLKTDLFELFNIDLMKESDEFFFERNGIWERRYAPEQFVFISFLENKNRKVLCNNSTAVDKEQIVETERYLASNFVLLDWRQFNLKPPKKFYNYKKLDHFTCITHVEWKHLYYKYVNSKPNRFAGFNFERIRLNLILLKYRFLKIIAKIITMFIFGKNNKNLRKKIRNKITGN